MSMIVKLAKILVPAALTLSAGAGFASEQEVAPPVAGLKIKKITGSGSGCADSSTYSTNISPDLSAFTVTFSEFIAEAGPGLPLSAGRKNCSLTLDLEVPAGYSFSIATVNYRGFMALDENVKAVHKTDYFFQGQGTTGRFSSTNVGPLSEDFVYTDSIGLVTQNLGTVRSPCKTGSRALTINPTIQVSKLSGADASAQGLITNDSVDGEISQKFGIKWYRCN